MAVRSLRQTLAAYRTGGGDPTTRLTDGAFLHASYTPAGPATLWLRWTRDPAPVDDCGLVAEAWGPGREWMLNGVDALTGTDDDPNAAMQRLDLGAEPVGEATSCYGARFGERSEPNRTPQAARNVTYSLESAAPWAVSR